MYVVNYLFMTNNKLIIESHLRKNNNSKKKCINYCMSEQKLEKIYLISNKKKKLLPHRKQKRTGDCSSKYQKGSELLLRLLQKISRNLFNVARY